MSGCLISDGKLFQSRGAATANVLAKRALCATDDQCSSVDRTQSSDTGVGDESAVVSQVARDVAGQRPMNQRGDLVVDVPTTDTYVLVNIKYTLLRCLVHGRK